MFFHLENPYHGIDILEIPISSTTQVLWKLSQTNFPAGRVSPYLSVDILIRSFLHLVGSELDWLFGWHTPCTRLQFFKYSPTFEDQKSQIPTRLRTVIRNREGFFLRSRQNEWKRRTTGKKMRKKNYWKKMKSKREMCGNNLFISRNSCYCYWYMRWHQFWVTFVIGGSRSWIKELH